MERDEALLTGAPLTGFYAMVCLTPWYLCRRNPLSERAAAVVGVTSIVSSMAAAGLWVAVWRTFGGPVGGWLWPVGTLLYLLSITLHYLVTELEALQAAREREMRSRVLAGEAELRALRQQVNPHFLFNSLNSISALTTMDKERARRMCIQLADFYRLSLAIGDRRLIPVSEELELVRRYLAIEQIRFDRRLRVEEEVDEATLGVMIPPLLLQPLIENAVKHGVAQMVEGGLVRIVTVAGGNDVLLAVENEFDRDAPRHAGAGVGLENVRRRLEAVYGSGARLDTRVEGGRFRAEVRMLTKGAAV